jgi:hypothetical protein
MCILRNGPLLIKHLLYVVGCIFEYSIPPKSAQYKQVLFDNTATAAASKIDF